MERVMHQQATEYAEALEKLWIVGQVVNSSVRCLTGCHALWEINEDNILIFNLTLAPGGKLRYYNEPLRKLWMDSFVYKKWIQIARKVLRHSLQKELKRYPEIKPYVEVK